MSRGLVFGAIVLVAGFSFVLTGCRTDCDVDGPEPTEGQIAREQKAFFRGQGTCRELLYPRILITDDHVVLKAVHENVITTRADLPANDVKRIEPLATRLKSYRTHFKKVRAAEPFEPTLYVTLDPKLEAARVASVFATAASVGFARSRFYVDTRDVDLQWWQRENAHKSKDAEMRALCIEPASDKNLLDLRTEDHSTSHIISTVNPTDASALETSLTTYCAAAPMPCADVVGINGGASATASDIVSLMKSVYAAKPFATYKPPILILATTNAAQHDDDLPCSKKIE